MPAHVQEYLKTKTFEDLTAELGIVVKKHDTLPLAIVNYNQIESPKTHPVVRECRGLVLHTESKSLVARSFNRFYNWGEVADEMPLFDFTDFVVDSKEDGSLVIIYYFDGEWHANTRGSFATDTMQGLDFTWREGFCKAMGIADLQELDAGLDRSVTYIGEFCSPFNKVVRRYQSPVMYLLTAFVGADEVPPKEISKYAAAYFKLPERYSFKSIGEIQAFLHEQSEEDATFEGVVIRDKNNRRWKLKNLTYLSLHKMRGEGDNLFHPKHTLSFILAGESDELLSYFPEVEETFKEHQQKVEAAYDQLEKAWEQHYNLPDQKQFALAIKDQTPFTGILFQLRKNLGLVQTKQDLKKLWRNSPDAILKIVFKK